MTETMLTHEWSSPHAFGTAIDDLIDVNSQEYFDVLFADPRPWWHELPPRKKPNYKNVKLTRIARLSRPYHKEPAQDWR